jgi:predicted small integral membrane protein
MAERNDPTSRSPGFLPIETNWFDRLFISIVIWVAVSLVWMRFIEPAGLSVWVATTLCALLSVFIVWKG